MSVLAALTKQVRGQDGRTVAKVHSIAMPSRLVRCGGPATVYVVLTDRGVAFMWHHGDPLADFPFASVLECDGIHDPVRAVTAVIDANLSRGGGSIGLPRPARAYPN